MHKILGKDWVEDYIKRKIKKDVQVRAILPSIEYLEKEIFIRDQQQRRICKPIKKVALISNKKQLTAIIESIEIYKTMKFIFKLAWKTVCLK